MNYFWLGFEKSANLIRDVQKALSKAKSAVKNVDPPAINWKTLSAPTDNLPVWKKKMLEAGKKPVGVDAKHVPRAQATPPPVRPAPAPVKDVHAEAAAEVARRRKMQDEGHTYLQYLEAEKAKAAKG